MPWQDGQIEPDPNAVLTLVALTKRVTIESKADRLS